MNGGVCVRERDLQEGTFKMKYVKSLLGQHIVSMKLLAIYEPCMLIKLRC